MSWVTIIWSMSAAVSLTLGAIYVLIWLQQRKAWANLVFSITALDVAWFAMYELLLMHAGSVERFGALLRWAHVPLFVLAAGIVGFVGLYLGTGRWWLGGAAVGVRLLCLILNFCSHPNLNYREITALKQVDFLGDRVWVLARSVPSRWSLLAEFGGLLVLIFVVDATLRLWRQGGPEARRRAAAVGGSLTLFMLAALAFAALVNAGVRQAVQHSIEGDGVYRTDFRVVFCPGARCAGSRGAARSNSTQATSRCGCTVCQLTSLIASLLSWKLRSTGRSWLT